MSVSVKFAFYPGPYFKCQSVTLFLSFFTLLYFYFFHACHHKRGYIGNMPRIFCCRLIWVLPSPLPVTPPPPSLLFFLLSVHYAQGEGRGAWTKIIRQQKIPESFPLIAMHTYSFWYFVLCPRASLSFISCVMFVSFDEQFNIFCLFSIRDPS